MAEPNISNLARVRRKLGPGPLRSLVLQVAGASGACGHRERWSCEAVLGRHMTDMGEAHLLLDAVLRSKDPDGRLAGDVGALQQGQQIQEKWKTSRLAQHYFHRREIMGAGWCLL